MNTEAAREALSAYEGARQSQSFAADLEAERARRRNGSAPARDTTWAPVDLAALLAGGELEQPPSMLARTDGASLLYAGKLHALSGEPESCKGWLALHAAAERLRAGETVLYVDLEDSPATAVARLLSLGVEPETIAGLHYVRPDEPLSDAAWTALAPALDPPPALCVVDGVTEALTLHGFKLEDNSEVARWLELLPRPLARTGAAVLLIDHVVKDRETRGRYAIGAQHKLAGVDVSYGLEVVVPFGRGRDGLVRVKVRKDRPGHVRQLGDESERIADMRLSSGDGGAVRVELVPVAEEGATSFRPTVLMERVSRAVESAPGLSARGIRASVGGKATATDLALELLIAEGYVECRRDGQSHAHHHAREYRRDG